MNFDATAKAAVPDRGAGSGSLAGTPFGPALLSVIVGSSAPGESGRHLLQGLPGVVRARLVVSRDGPELPEWLDLVAGLRISADLSAELVPHLGPRLGADLRVRQVRVHLAPETGPFEMRACVDAIRGNSDRPPLVFLLNVGRLSTSPEPWAIVANWLNVFINITRAHDGPDVAGPYTLAGPSLAEALRTWRRVLGERLFVSIPPLAAHADDPGAGGCLSRLGLHMVWNADAQLILACDCVSGPGIPVDRDGHWLEVWRRHSTASAADSAEICNHCPLWNACRGGCMAPVHAQTLRDAHCPWPDRVFDGGAKS